MVYLDPADENVHALLARGIEGPVVMLNLLRFKAQADYNSCPELAPSHPISGRQAYDLYMEHTLPLLEATGGSLLFEGDGGRFFVGPADKGWDLALLVRQASIESFFGFATNPDFLAIAGHREAALEDSRILPLVEHR